MHGRYCEDNIMLLTFLTEFGYVHEPSKSRSFVLPLWMKHWLALLLNSTRVKAMKWWMIFVIQIQEVADKGEKEAVSLDLLLPVADDDIRAGLEPPSSEVPMRHP